MHVCTTPTGIGAELPLRSAHCSIAPPGLAVVRSSGVMPLPKFRWGTGKGFWRRLNFPIGHHSFI